METRPVVHALAWLVGAVLHTRAPADIPIPSPPILMPNHTIPVMLDTFTAADHTAAAISAYEHLSCDALSWHECLLHYATDFLDLNPNKVFFFILASTIALLFTLGYFLGLVKISSHAASPAIVGKVSPMADKARCPELDEQVRKLQNQLMAKEAQFEWQLNAQRAFFSDQLSEEKTKIEKIRKELMAERAQLAEQMMAESTKLEYQLKTLRIESEEQLSVTVEQVREQMKAEVEQQLRYKEEETEKKLKSSEEAREVAAKQVRDQMKTDFDLQLKAQDDAHEAAMKELATKQNRLQEAHDVMQTRLVHKQSLPQQAEQAHKDTKASLRQAVEPCRQSQQLLGSIPPQHKIATPKNLSPSPAKCAVVQQAPQAPIVSSQGSATSALPKTQTGPTVAPTSTTPQAPAPAPAPKGVYLSVWADPLDPDTAAASASTPATTTTTAKSQAPHVQSPPTVRAPAAKSNSVLAPKPAERSLPIAPAISTAAAKSQAPPTKSQPPSHNPAAQPNARGAAVQPQRSAPSAPAATTSVPKSRAPHTTPPPTPKTTAPSTPNTTASPFSSQTAPAMTTTTTSTSPPDFCQMSAGTTPPNHQGSYATLLSAPVDGTTNVPPPKLLDRHNSICYYTKHTYSECAVETHPCKMGPKGGCFGV